MNDFFREIRQAFLANRVRSLARKLNSAFNQLLVILKRGEYVIAERQRAERDRAEFLEQNREMQIDQNVVRNTDNKHAYKILWATSFLEGVLSWKGMQYLMDHFAGVTNLIVIIPSAAGFALSVIYMSIVMNHFAKRYRQESFSRFVFLTIASYVLIFIIPVCNLLEAYQSNGGPDGDPYIIALNWVLVLVTLYFHSALITMSSVIITAKNSKVALAELSKKDNALKKIESKVRALNTSFFNAKEIFSQSAREFVAAFMEMEGQNPELARKLLYLLDNFTIWMVNNKVFQHQVLPYHGNEQGQPVVEVDYFDPKLTTLVRGWDQLSSMNIYNTNGQDGELPGAVHPTMELPDNERQPDNGQQRDETADEVRSGQEGWGSNGEDAPPSSDPLVDPTEPNPNEKIL
jgi:F0F1-type ATP synthase assembly protein I